MGVLEKAAVGPILIGRAAQGERLLPPINAHLYAPAHMAHPSEGRRLLTSASAPLPFHQRALARGLTPEGRIRRVVWMHAQAFSAELAGQEERADYFWERGAAALGALLADPAAQATSLGRDLPARLLDELFIDTHCAFYNGHLLSAEPLAFVGGRAAAHAARVCALARLAPGGPERYAELLRPICLAYPRAAVDAGLPAAFVEALRASPHLLEEAPRERSVGEPLAGAPWPASRQAVPVPVSPLDAPVLTPAPRAAFQRGEPFELWLFSRSDPGLKLLAASAALLLALALGMTAQDWLGAATGDAAYARVLDAAGRRDYLAIVDAAPAFLRSLPRSGDDPRAAQVRDLYAEAFVRWFASLDADEADGARPRVERFRELMGAATRRGP